MIFMIIVVASLLCRRHTVSSCALQTLSWAERRVRCRETASLLFALLPTNCMYSFVIYIITMVQLERWERWAMSKASSTGRSRFTENGRRLDLLQPMFEKTMQSVALPVSFRDTGKTVLKSRRAPLNETLTASDLFVVNVISSILLLLRLSPQVLSILLSLPNRLTRCTRTVLYATYKSF